MAQSVSTQVQPQSGLISPFSMFGRNKSIGTPGATTSQVGKGLMGLFGGIGQNSTVPFAGGGNASPGNLNPGLNLGNGNKSLGINAQSPNQNSSPVTSPVAPQAGAGANVNNPFGFTKNADGTVTDANGKVFGTPNTATPQNGGTQYNDPVGGGAPGTNPNAVGPGPNGVNTVLPGGNGAPGNQTMTPASIAATLAASGTTPQPGSAAANATPGSVTPNTVAGLLPGLLATNNQPDVQNIINEEQKAVGDTLTGQPGLPLDLAQGRAGLIENTANQALSQLQNEQSLQQGAYGKALGAVAPITGVPYGTQTVQPGLIGTGNASGPSSMTGAGVPESDPFYQTMQTYAQQLVNNQGSSIPSSVTSNPALQAQLIQMAKAIDPNFNYNTATGIGSAQQSNAATGGTASTTANQGIYNTAMGSLANYTNMANNIKSFGDLAVQNIASLPLTSSQAANMTIGQALQQFNNPAYAKFTANIQGLQARVSDLLSTGEIPSAGTAGAQSIINGNLNLGSLQSTLQQINDEADAIVSNQAGIASSAYSNIQSNSGSGSSSGSGWSSLGD